MMSTFGKGGCRIDENMFKYATLNLTDTLVPTALDRVLGPDFRATPKPVTNRRVASSLRQFAGSTRNKAFFALCTERCK